MRTHYRTQTSRDLLTGAPGLARMQRGLSLMIVLIALVLMSIAAIGLIRMVDTGTLIIGNMAFKQGTTSAADNAGEAAIRWIRNSTATDLENDNDAAGYYATSLTALDVTGKSGSLTRALVDWYDDNCAYAASDSYSVCKQPKDAGDINGYSIKYVITRMCKTAGGPNATGNNCAKPVSRAGTESPETNSIDYTDPARDSKPPGPYFRIVVRAQGPRNTVSFTEAYVHF